MINPLPPAVQAAIADAERRGIAVTPVSRSRSARDDGPPVVAAGEPQIAKTIVVERRGAATLVVLALPARIDWPALRAVLGTSRLRLPTAERALELTGYERGTITPFGAAGDWPVVVDETLLGQRMSLGSGAHGWGLQVDIDDLVRGFGATVAAIEV